ncbi:MAG: hypothetical protein LIO81_09730 [Clostridiales bacterium]|nr:hypothetical protein [Clostridiales bacterium]
MKLKRGVVRLLLTACLVAGLMPAGMLTSHADTEVSYRYYDEDREEWRTSSVSNYTSVASDSTSWSNGWYVVDSNVTIKSRITVSGTVNLILVDGYTLTASSGINVGQGGILNIYGQTEDSGTVVATAKNQFDAAIGSNSHSPGSTGTITINGGTVEVDNEFGGNGAGIGDGFQSAGGNITIRGGMVVVKIRGYGSGIGSGYNSSGDSTNITISGGTVNVTSNYGAGIGAGDGAGNHVYVDISNGYVKAKSSQSHAIGGGRTDITITGGYFGNGDTEAQTVYDVAPEKDYAVYSNTGDDSGTYPVYVAEKTYTITATAGEGGSITLKAADMSKGGHAVYEITPDEGYEIDVVTVDGADVTRYIVSGRYTFTNIQDNHTISVTFKLTGTTTTTYSGDRSSGSDDDDSSSGSASSNDSGTWVQDGSGWRYVYEDGSYEAGAAAAGGDSAGQVSWKQIDGKWWAFKADGYLSTGWVLDQNRSLWYYVDETTGMKTGWHYDAENGCWYYLDPVSGHMLTGWQWIDGKWYYFNGDPASPTWVFDENLNKWVYDESTSHRPFGAMYADEDTPDGYTVGKDGSREDSENEQQAEKQAEEQEGGR